MASAVRDTVLTDGVLATAFGNFNVDQSLADKAPPEFGDQRWSSWRVFVHQVPRTLTTLTSSSERWTELDRHILHTVRSMYGESWTTARANVLIRGMLSEYEGSVVYRNAKGTWQKYVPAQITAAVLPLWYPWALDAFDELRMFGFTVLAFAPDPSAGGQLVDRRIAVTVSPLDVDVFINTTATELRYDFTNEVARRKFKRAYIIVDRMPRFATGSTYGDPMRAIEYGMPVLDTPISRLLPDYINLIRARRYDMTAMTISTTRPFIVQHNEKADLQKMSLYSLSTRGRQSFLECPSDFTMDQTVEQAKRIVPLADAVQPVKSVSLPMALGEPYARANAGIVSLHGDEQLAAIVPTKDFNPAIMAADLDRKVASLAGYPMVGGDGDTGRGKGRSSSASSSSASSSSTKTVGIGSAKTAKGAGGSIIGGSGGEGGGIHEGGESQGVATIIGYILLSSLEELLSLAWNAAFSQLNTTLAKTMMTVIDRHVSSHLGPRVARKVIQTCIPVVTLSMPSAAIPTDVPLPIMQMLPFTEALLPLKLGITPRGYDRMRMFSVVHGEFKRRKLASEEQEEQIVEAGVVLPSSSSSSSTSSHKKK